MLLGRYQHTLDAKGRVFVPAKLRETLGERFVATKARMFASAFTLWKNGPGRRQSFWPCRRNTATCSGFTFPTPRNSSRISKGASCCPPTCGVCGLENDVVIMGVGNRVEIWNAADRQANTSELTPQSAAMLMDELGI